MADDVVYRVFFDKTARYGRVCFADACEKQSEIVVDFRRCAYGASRIAGAYFLFDGNCRRQSFYVVAFRFLHPAQKLASVGRQAFHVASLALGIERVECQ